MVGLNLAPKVEFVREISEKIVGFLESFANVLKLKHILKLVLIHVNQELVCVDILGHRNASQDHVDERLNEVLIESSLQGCQVVLEPIVWSKLITF